MSTDERTPDDSDRGAGIGIGIRIRAIDHVQVTVPPALESEALRFYGEVLGLERIPKPAESAKRGGAWFRHGAMQVHVSIEPIEVDSNRASKRHVCYLVESLTAAEDALRAHGIEILADPTPEPGWPRFYVRDPAGNRIEIAQPA
jgi:catechol 2,3-dioxygenase-like lactoylglutathione lyase family enzyme